MADIEAQSQTSSQDPSAIFKTTNRPVTLKFEDVVYKIKEKKGGLIGMSKKPVDKMILKGLTGVVYPGEMLAMLGPSGSGKTTLLTALGGRLGGCLGGRITYNAKPFTNQMKRNTGFVTQDDVVYEHLTVFETLAYTALLRLPNTLTSVQKIAQADAVMGELGLTKCRNSVVGGPMLRGISGGERKRVSIGQEMLINPSLLFLDEPTSGLDSTTAQRIVSTLWGLANGGRTVVMTIHQPSSRLFYMFHKVMVLSEGHSLYFGFGSEVMNYFSSIGYAPSIAMNPSDFLLDLANGISSDDGEEDQNVTKQALVSSYKSELLDKVLAEVCKNDGQVVQDKVGDKDFGRWTTTWWQQFSVLIKRGVKERRHESFSWLHIIQVAVVSLLCGLLWWQSSIAHLQDQIGLLFFYSGFWAFYPLFQAIFTFPRERMMLAKERSSGMYRLSSFFMAYTMADLPMELVLPTAFTIVTYWMAGLKPTALNFFLTLFVVLYNVLVSQGLGLAIGALVMNQKSASTLASVIMLSFLLASGYYVQHVPAFISWIKYVSISHHIYKLLLGSQYKPGDTYPCGLQVCYVSDFPIVNLIGLEGQLASVAAVFVMVVGYRLVAYVALMRIGVPK